MGLKGGGGTRDLATGPGEQCMWGKHSGTVEVEGGAGFHGALASLLVPRRRLWAAVGATRHLAIGSHAAKRALTPPPAYSPVATLAVPLAAQVALPPDVPRLSPRRILTVI